MKGKVDSCFADATLQHCIDEKRDVFKNLLLDSVNEFDVIVTTGGTSINIGDDTVRIVRIR